MVKQTDDGHSCQVDIGDAVYPAHLIEITCREHRDDRYDIRHGIEESDAASVLCHVKQYLSWRMMEVPSAIPVCRHNGYRYVLNGLLVKTEDASVKHCSPRTLLAFLVSVVSHIDKV